jgi:hypothetical protein
LYEERFCYRHLNVKFATRFSFHSAEGNPSVTLPV